MIIFVFVSRLETDTGASSLSAEAPPFEPKEVPAENEDNQVQEANGEEEEKPAGNEEDEDEDSDDDEDDVQITIGDIKTQTTYE